LEEAGEEARHGNRAIGVVQAGKAWGQAARAQGAAEVVAGVVVAEVVAEVVVAEVVAAGDRPA
jgi:hypothetical protein